MESQWPGQHCPLSIVFYTDSVGEYTSLLIKSFQYKIDVILQCVCVWISITLSLILLLLLSSSLSLWCENVVWFFFLPFFLSLSLSFAGVHISEPFIQHSITSNYNANDSMAGDGSRVVVRTLIVFRSIMFCIGKQQSTPQTLHHSNLLGFDYLFGIIGIICIYIYCGNSRRKYKFNKNAHKHKSRNP